ncbi:MAG TPA: hypothetical protein VF131_01925 [Blastocatellia bacterium]|nr:hypothetical protein [Blastocatellia bacterium]
MDGINNSSKRGSPFDLTGRDYEWLGDSYITPELANEACLYRVDTITGAQETGHEPTATRNFAGIIFPYFHPLTGYERERALRRDEPDYEDDKAKGKYVGPPGRTNIFYVPVGVNREWLKDKSIPIIFVEGEKKCLALWRIARDYSVDGAPLFIPIGLRGCWGWKGNRGKRDLPGPGHEQDPGPINDFDFFEWEGRITTLLPDSNYETNPKVKAAWNGLRDHTHHNLKARVFFAFMPQSAHVNGCDDLAALQGPDAVLELLDNAVPAIKPTIQPETKEERQSKKEALRQFARQQAAKEDEYTHTRRRATSADFAAVSTICAELEWKDKARVGLQALVGLSGGQLQFEWRYGELYPYLRRFDAALFRDTEDKVIDQKSRRKVPSKKAKKALSKINGIVRGYIDAIDAEQKRCGVELAHTDRGTKHFDDNGNKIFEPSKTSLPILSCLEEIDELAKANPSYSKHSKAIRAEEARLMASKLSKYTPPEKQKLTARQEVIRALKRAAGNINSVIKQMRAMDYEDWAIQQDFRKHLPTEFLELMFGDDGLNVTFEQDPIVEDDTVEGESPSESYLTDSETVYKGEKVDDLP